MRLYHSLWTKPMSEDKVYATRILFATSFGLAKKSGAEIVLHTDTKGAEILKEIPYDQVFIDLDDIDDKYTSFWAYGKLVATQNEPLGSIHFDGDVFFKEPKLLKTIDETECDLFVQNEEHSKWREPGYYEVTQIILGQENYPLNINYPASYNCGITKFNNQELKDKYLKTYFDTVEKCIDDEKVKKRYDALIYKQYYIPDLVAEQQSLHELGQGYKVECLLKGQDMMEESNKKGFCHLCSRAKWEQIEEVENYAKSVGIRIPSCEKK